jgi:hypothetical protein
MYMEVPNRVAAQCFLVLYVEKMDVPYGGRMVPWLCFVASTAVLFARDIGIGMLTIILFCLNLKSLSAFCVTGFPMDTFGLQVRY